MANIRNIPGTESNLPPNRLQEAIKHLRQNTEFEYVIDHIRTQHNKLWKQFLRDPNVHMHDMQRGKAAAYADLYQLLTGKDIVE